MSCTSYQEWIALWIEGDLPNDQIRQVEEHLQSCSECKAFADEMKESQIAFGKLRDFSDNDFVYTRIRQSVLEKIAPAGKQQHAFSWYLRVFVIATSFAIVAVGSALIYNRLLIPDQQTTSEQHHPKPIARPKTAETSKTNPVIQQKEATVFGVVLDSNKSPLPGVTVTLRTAKSEQRRTATNAHGEFQFDGLSSGTYSANFEVEGFTRVQRNGIKIENNRDVKLMAKLNPSTAEEVVVVGDTPIVSAPSQSSNRVYHENVPSSRDPWVAIEQNAVDGGRLDAETEEKLRSLGYVGGSTESGKETGFYARSQTTQTEVPAPAEGPPAPAPMPELAPMDDIGSKEGALGGTPQGTLKAPTSQSEAQLVVIEKNESDRNQEPGRVTQGTLQARDTEGEIVGEFPLKHTEVNAEISGYMASTIVEQQYTNPYKEAIEAVYVFPLPSMAAIHDFVMEIGNQKIVGVVRPREEAERIYQEAKERGQTASLLTQERPNIFTQNVANIEPGGRVNIKITYFERLSYEKGYYEYAFPMVVGPRYIPGTPQSTSHGKSLGGGWSAPTNQVPDADKITPPVLRPGQRSGHDIGVTVHLDAGLPIEDLKCVTHRMQIQDDGVSRRTLRLIESDSIPNRDLVLRWSVADKQVEMGMLAHHKKNGGYFTIMMQPPLQPSDSQVTPREITFILDVSGSMSGIPMDMSKEIVRRTLDRMRPEDIFNIFIFSGGNGQLWENPQPKTEGNIATAKNFLNTLQGSGGTEMLAGLRRAINAKHDSKYLQMYVFLTDGYVGNEDEILKVVREEKRDARIFAFGIGSSVNRYLIDGIGKFGNGASQVVLPRDSEYALRAADQFYNCIDSPVLVDISIDWNGLPVKEVYPHKIRDLFAGQTISVIGRYDQAAKGTAIVRARIGSRPVQFEIKMNLPKEEDNNSALEAVWARHKIEELSETMMVASGPEQQSLVKQITDLGVSHRLVTQFTAFVAVDESRVVSNGNPLRVLQPVELPEGVRYEGIFGEQAIGQPMQISSWGLILGTTQSGKIYVCYVNPSGVASQSGIKSGMVLKALNRFAIHSFGQLNGLLLQAGGKTVVLEFDKGESVYLPIP
jgi:Ca-activated chloride channel family protein